MKKILTAIALTVQCIFCVAQTNTDNKVHSEVMAWSNITGVRLDGELIDFESAHIALDLSRPGSRFVGFGGNFRIQNSKKDPAVIDYCLRNMRVAMGRVEFPWASWDKGGKADPHVVESARMAARLKAIGMPLVFTPTSR